MGTIGRHVIKWGGLGLSIFAILISSASVWYTKSSHDRVVDFAAQDNLYEAFDLLRITPTPGEIGAFSLNKSIVKLRTDRAALEKDRRAIEKYSYLKPDSPADNLFSVLYYVTYNDLNGVKEELKKIKRKSGGISDTELYVILSIFYASVFNLNTAALELLQKAEDIDPKNKLVYFTRAILLYRNGEKEKALEQFETITRIFPEDADMYAFLAMQLHAIWENDRAIDYFKQAIQINKGNADYYNGLGHVFYESGLKVEAEDVFNHALTLNPKNSDVHNYLGIIFYAKQKYDKAIYHYEKAIELSSTQPQYYANLGLAFKPNNNPEKAKWAFDKA